MIGEFADLPYWFKIISVKNFGNFSHAVYEILSQIWSMWSQIELNIKKTQKNSKFQVEWRGPLVASFDQL